MAEMSFEIDMPTAEIEFDVSGASGVSHNLQEKTVTPTTSQQEVTPDEGYYGLNRVNVEGYVEQPQFLIKSGWISVANASLYVNYLGFQPDLLVLNMKVTPTTGTMVYNSTAAIDFRPTAGTRFGALKYYSKYNNTYYIFMLGFNASCHANGFTLSNCKFTRMGAGETTQLSFNGGFNYIAYKFL